MKKHFVQIVQIVIWSTPIILGAGLLWHYVQPDGVRVVDLAMGDESPYIQRLLPDERVQISEDGAMATVIEEPVYFSVTPPPGGFTQAEITVDLDAQHTPLVELGGLVDVASQSFDFRPLTNRLLDELSWPRYDLGDGRVLLAREATPGLPTTFFTQTPPRSDVAVYRADFPLPYREVDYQPLDRLQTFNVSLRGPHEFLTYIKDESLFIRFSYHDINRTFGADEAAVKVLNENGEVVANKDFSDDGNIQENQNFSPLTSFELRVYDLSEGVYRLVFSGTSDIVWRSMATSQRYFVAKNRIFLSDEVGYWPEPRPVTLFTDAKRVTTETQHVEGLQTLTLGNKPIVLSSVQEKVIGVASQSGLLELASPVGDVKLTGEGKYAFSRESFFNPDPVSINAFTDPSSLGVDYILATSSSERAATFDLAGLTQENGAYKFALSVPGIDLPNGQVDVSKVTISFSRSSRGLTGVLPQIKSFIKQLLP